MPDFAMPHVLRSLTTCEATTQMRWRRGESRGWELTNVPVLEQLCIVKDYDAAGNVTDVRQEWRPVPTEEA